MPRQWGLCVPKDLNHNESEEFQEVRDDFPSPLLPENRAYYCPYQRCGRSFRAIENASNCHRMHMRNVEIRERVNKYRLRKILQAIL